VCYMLSYRRNFNAIDFFYTFTYGYIYTSLLNPYVNVTKIHYIYSLKTVKFKNLSCIHLHMEGVDMKENNSVRKITDFLKDNSVFKKATVLSENYIPDKFLFREEEIKKIMHNLTGYFEGIPPNNMFIVGSPSTGKTHIMLAISNTLNEHAMKEGDNIKYIYVNVGGKTLPQILVDIASKLGLNVVINFGLGILSMINKKLNGNYCFIFDEFDRIKKTTDYQNPYDVIINSFSRIGSHVRIVVIANNMKIFDKLEAPTQSSFSPNKLYFRPYNADEITEILKDRCERAFNEGVIDEEVVARFGAWIYRTGVDLRTAFKVLLSAGRLVGSRDNNGKKQKITFDDLQISFKEVEKNILREVLSKLNDTELFFIHSIAIAQRERGKSEVEKNTVYSTYQRLCNNLGMQPLSWRHLSTYIAPKIEIQGIIKSEVHGRGKGKGTSTFFSIDGSEINEMIQMTTSEINKRIADDAEAAMFGGGV